MNKNSWYHSHSFKFCGLTWEFTYIEATASRTIQTTKADGTKINLSIPIKDTTKFPYPLAWLEKWEKKEKEKLLRSAKGEKPKTLFDLTPSNLAQSETEKTLLGVNEAKEPASMEKLTPSKCLSCSFCQRISPILLTCLASPKYFIEETAKECDRFTPIAPKIQPEGNLETISKRPRRRRGNGSGTFITTYANKTKYGKKYPQISYQVEFAGKKRSIYLIPEKIEQMQELDRQGLPINEILEAIDSPKARKILKEYKDFLESKEEKN
jgi:hypothetical protein